MQLVFTYMQLEFCYTNVVNGIIADFCAVMRAYNQNSFGMPQ